MKIKSIKIHNNPVLGNVSLDFTNSEGHIADTVILAGENGSGKSTILNIIYEFSNYNLKNKMSNEKREFIFYILDKDIEIFKNNSKICNYFENAIQGSELHFVFDYSIINNWGQIIVRLKEITGNYINIPSAIFTEEDIKSILKTVFSDVEINFNTQNISSVTSKDIDQAVSSSVKSNSNLATDITQLLIYIQALDAQEFFEWGQRNIGNKVENNMLDLRMKRFKEAFDFMFPTKKYKGVRNENNLKKVIFDELGQEIYIDSLSSGEKQIIFRGSFLLKDQNSNKGAIVLIDEPEISLHPRWQLKILDFYRKLFTDEEGVQTSQLFVVTHSPFIIHNTSRINDKVIILNKNESGQVFIPEEQKYFGWTYENAVREAFNIDIDFGSSEYIVFVEGETDEVYLKKSIEVLDKGFSGESINWVGRISDQGKIEFTGKSGLDQAKAFFLANPQFLKGKVILLYDSDANKQNEQHGNLYVRSIPKNDENKTYKIGIENLLSLQENFLKDKFIKETKKEDEYSAESIIRKLDKNSLCKWVCSELTPDIQKKYFEKFAIITDILEEIVKNKKN